MMSNRFFSWSSPLMPFCLLITKLFLILLYYVCGMYKSNFNFGAGCSNWAIWAILRFGFAYSRHTRVKLKCVLWLGGPNASLVSSKRNFFSSLSNANRPFQLQSGKSEFCGSHNQVFLKFFLGGAALKGPENWKNKFQIPKMLNLAFEFDVIA